MKNVYITIGLPSCGKSTFMKKHMTVLSLESYANLNADIIREAFTGDAMVQSSNKYVFKAHHEIYKKILLSPLPNHQHIVIDNTSLTKEMRSQYRRFAEELDVECKFHLYYFDASPETCILRQRSRHRKVPESVIYNMARKIERPTAEELAIFGCNSYTVVM